MTGIGTMGGDMATSKQEIESGVVQLIFCGPVNNPLGPPVTSVAISVIAAPAAEKSTGKSSAGTTMGTALS